MPMPMPMPKFVATLILMLEPMAILMLIRAVSKIMRFFFLMGIQGRFKNIFSRLELCIKIFYYSRKTLRISVTFIGIGDGGEKKVNYS